MQINMSIIIYFDLTIETLGYISFIFSLQRDYQFNIYLAALIIFCWY